MNKKILVCALALALAGPPAYAASGKPEYRKSYTYNKRTKTWKSKAVKKETTSDRIHKLLKKTWRKR